MMQNRSNAHATVSVLTVLSVELRLAPGGAQDFYAGKQITLIVGAGVGGGYDHQARLVARHLGRHIAGTPPIIVQNMPAAGSMAATNYMFQHGSPRWNRIAAPFNAACCLPAHLSEQRSLEIDKFRWFGESQQRNGRDAGVECDLHASEREGFAGERVDRWRDRGRRPGNDTETLQFLAGDKIQGRHRIQQYG